MHILGLALLLHPPALADVPPPDTEGCDAKAEADPCRTDAGVDGACRKSTCSRLDYSKGTPPGSVSYECMVCTPAAGAAPTHAEAPPQNEPTKTGEAVPKDASPICATGGAGGWAALLLAAGSLGFRRRARA
jgi:uncharacterized protein (TIGR03382 family)